MNRAYIAAIALLAIGCAETKTTVCGDLICPPGTVCSLRHEGCFEPDQLDACDAAADGTVCSYSDVTGSCDRGVCFPLVCGDGIVVAPEQCEPDNLGGLSCHQFGFYEAAGLGCNDDCTVNTDLCIGRCGDGEVNGPELCDSVPGDSFTCFETGFDYGAVQCSPALCAPVYDDCVRFGWTESPHPYDYIGDAFVRDNGDLFIPANNEYTLVNRFDQNRVRLPDDCDRAERIWASDTAVHVGCVDPDGGLLSVRHRDDAFETFAITGLTNIADLFGFGDDDIYVVGDGVAHFDGTQWSSVSDPALDGVSFSTMHGRGGKLALVGDSSTLVVFDSGAWTRQTLPATSLEGVYVTGAGEVYALGDDQIWFESGGNWLSSAPTAANNLRSIHGLGQDAIYAYGTGGTFGDGIWKFDGTHWLELDPPSALPFYDRMIGSDRHLSLIYPYGSFFDSSGYGFTPQPSRASGNLDDVWLFAPDNAIAIGPNIEYRWDGTTWTESNHGFSLPGARMWASAPDNIVVISGNGDIIRYNGSQWVDESPTFATGNLFEIAGTAPDNIFVLARRGFNPVVLHYNGSAWSEAFVESAGGYPESLWAHPDRGVFWTSGGLLYINAPGDPPSVWRQIGLPLSEFTGDIWGDDSELVVTFRGGRAFRLLADESWVEVEVRLRTAPSRLTGSADDLFGISPTEGLVRRSNGSWDRIRVPPLGADDPRGVFAGNGGVAIVGEGGFAGLLIRP